MRVAAAAFLLAAGFGCLCAAPEARADELRVPSAQYPSLGAALGAARPGDRIVMTDAVERVRRGRFTIRTPDLELAAEDGFVFDRSTIRVRADGVTLRGFVFSGTRIDARGSDFTLAESRFEGFVRPRRVRTTVRIRGARGAFTDNSAQITASRSPQGIWLLRVKGDDATLAGNDVTVRGGAFEIKGARATCADNEIVTLPAERPANAYRYGLDKAVRVVGADAQLSDTAIDAADDGLFVKGENAFVERCDVTATDEGVEIRSDDGRLIGGEHRSLEGIRVDGARVVVEQARCLWTQQTSFSRSLVRVSGLDAVVRDADLDGGGVVAVGISAASDLAGGPVTVEGCSVRNTVKAAIATFDQALVRDCVVEGPAGIVVNGVYSTVTGNTLSGAGIEIDRSYVTVTDNDIVRPDIGVVTRRDHVDTTIRGNTITGAIRAGVRVLGRRFVVEDNVISMDLAATTPTVHVSGNRDHDGGRVAGNSGTRGAGVWVVLEGDGTTLEGNELTRATGPGDVAVTVFGHDNVIAENDLGAGVAPGGGIHVTGNRNVVRDQAVPAPRQIGLLIDGNANEALRVDVEDGLSDGFRVLGNGNAVSDSSALSCVLVGFANDGVDTTLTLSLFQGNGVWDVATTEPFALFDQVTAGTIDGP